MRLLITGGAGFIGSSFVDYQRLHHPEDAIVCLDLLTYAGRRENLPKQDQSFTFIQGDLADAALIGRIFEQFSPDIVVNFAAETHVDRSIEAPERFLHSNVMGVGVLLEACRRHPFVRFHQISTDEVYGELPLHAKNLLFSEESPLRPSSPYAASKASADLLVLSYGRTYGLPVSISRCSNNYGIRQHREKLIPTLIACAQKNEPLPIYGSGRQVRDWISVQDHCSAVDLIIRSGRDNAVYNVGAGCELENRCVARAILELMPHSRSKLHHVPDRPGHDLRYGVDAGKLQRELGWRPSISFEDGLRETVHWYLSHPQALTRQEC